MSFIERNCTLDILTEDTLLETNPFVCGDNDMNDFFQKDAIIYTQYRMGKTYCFRIRKDLKQVVACFTVSNDSIRIYDLPSSRKNAMWGITHREKMLTRYPGVLIGRLAVAVEFSNKGIGSEILDFIKMWFLDEENKTGCRFAIVDAKNETNVLHFYERNGFKTLFPREIDEDFYTKPPKNEKERAQRLLTPRKLQTRLMFCDLLNE